MQTIAPLLLLTAALTLGACSSPTTPVSSSSASSPLPAASCAVLADSPPAADLGVVTMVCSPARAAFQLSQGPLTRSEASAAGTREALREVLKGGGDMGEAIILLPAVVAVAALGGSLYGAVSGVNEQQLIKMDAAVSGATAEFAPVQRLSRSMLARSDALAVRSMTLETDPVPTQPPETRMRLRIGATGALVRTAPPVPSHPLAARGVDTLAVLEFSHGLSGDEKYDPAMGLWQRLRVRFVRTRDWSEAGELVVEYRTEPRRFAEWAADGARAFREEWEHGLTAVEAQLIGWLQRSASARPLPPSADRREK